MTETERIVAKADEDAEQARDTSAHRWIFGLVAAGAAFAVVLFVLVLVLRGQVADVAGQQSTAAVAAQRLAAQIRQHGLTPVVQAPAPIVVQPVVITGKQGPGPTQQQIDNAVIDYFAAHPPGATPAMVGVQVAAYLTAHPPKPGPPPTPAQIATAAADYIAAHAADFQGVAGTAGTNGANGSPGADATDAQVASAVTAYCDAHSQCQGPTGATGPQGPPVASWSWQDPTSGVTETCTRDSGSPDDAPTYTCRADTTTSTPPSAGLLNLGGH